MAEEIPGTATAEDAADQQDGQQAAAASADTPASGASASGAPPATEESFIDVSQLPDELKPHWKRMHGAYTKAQQRFRDAGEKAALVDRFNTDPAFMLQTVQQAAAQLGYQMVKAGDGTVAAAQPPAGQPGQAPTPPQLVEAVRSRLDPSLHPSRLSQAEVARSFDAEARPSKEGRSVQLAVELAVAQGDGAPSLQLVTARILYAYANPPCTTASVKVVPAV